MKNLKDITLIIALLLVGAFTACKKGGESGPGDDKDDQLTNSAQLFFDDNTSIVQEGNEAVTATYIDKKLKISFSQNGNEVALEVPNYDINAETTDLTNANVALNLKKDGQTYNSAFIFTPVFIGNPPIPYFVLDKTIAVKTTNLKVNDNTTDISIQVTNGSTLITPPVPGAGAPAYDDIVFV
ncbi:MAG: hypothetical protein EOP51_32255, partial [Sphingobacteriales bacterium]